MASPLAPAFAAIAFDLDGTLVDSRRDLATAINSVRAGRGLAPHPPAAVEGMVGEGVQLLVARAFAGELGESELAAILAEFLAAYDRHCLATTRPYPRVPDLLAAAAARWRLAVLTNKPERFATRIVVELGLGRWLPLVVGGDSLPVRKPDPAALRAVAGRLGVPAERLLMVGDSPIDLATAAAAGSPRVAVTWGYGRFAPADLAAADGVARSVADLAVLLGLPPSPGGGEAPASC